LFAEADWATTAVNAATQAILIALIFVPLDIERKKKKWVTAHRSLVAGMYRDS